MAHGRNFPHLCLHLAEQRDFRSCWLQKTGPEVPCPMPFGVLFLKPALKLLLHTSVPRGPAEEMNAVGGPTLAVTQAGPGERGGLKINHNQRAIKPFGVSQSQHLSPKLLLWDQVSQPGPTMLPFHHQACALLAGSCTSSSFCQACVRGFGAVGPPLHRAKGTSHRTGQAWGPQPSGTLCGLPEHACCPQGLENKHEPRGPAQGA